VGQIDPLRGIGLQLNKSTTEARRHGEDRAIWPSDHRAIATAFCFSDHPITRSPDHPILLVSVPPWWIFLKLHHYLPPRIKGEGRVIC